MFQFEYFSVVLLDVFQVVKDWTWCLLTRSSLLTATLIRRTTYKPQHGLIELAKRGIARDRNFGIKGIDRRQIADVASVNSNLERSASPENLLDCLYTNILLVLLKLCRRKQYSLKCTTCFQKKKLWGGNALLPELLLKRGGKYTENVSLKDKFTLS